LAAIVTMHLRCLVFFTVVLLSVARRSIRTEYSHQDAQLGNTLIKVLEGSTGNREAFRPVGSFHVGLPPARGLYGAQAQEPQFPTPDGQVRSTENVQMAQKPSPQRAAVARAENEKKEFFKFSFLPGRKEKEKKEKGRKEAASTKVKAEKGAATKKAIAERDAAAKKAKAEAAAKKAKAEAAAKKAKAEKEAAAKKAKAEKEAAAKKAKAEKARRELAALSPEAQAAALRNAFEARQVAAEKAAKKDEEKAAKKKKGVTSPEEQAAAIREAYFARTEADRRAAGKVVVPRETENQQVGKGKSGPMFRKGRSR